MKFSGKPVGDGKPCFIIAEAGSNHDGRLTQALKLIDVAADAGADAVKFQTFRAQTLYPHIQFGQRYVREMGLKKSIYDTIRAMEMPVSWLPKLAAHCRRRHVLFMSTPFDERAVDMLAPLVPAFKIASYELTHLPLVRKAASKGKPLILSTGAADMGEIAAAVRAASRAPVCLMQCTAKYPAPPDSLNLKAIVTLKKRFGVPVGLSDHSTDPATAPVTAVALGANLIEKHFTLSRRLKGPDHCYAVEPRELKAMVKAVRDAEAALGTGVKAPHAVEKDLREYRRGVFSLRRIERGERFSEENAAVLRRAGKPETDLKPGDFPRLLRRCAARPLPAHRLLSLADVR